MPPEAQVLEFLAAAEKGTLPARRFSNATGYDAVIDQGQRKRPSGVNRSEDQELTPFDRWRLYTAGRDIARNFSAVGFAVRKHLDYVSKFSFRNKTKGSPGEKFHALLRHWSKPANCDVAGRHGLLRSIRMAERARTVDGDVLPVKINDGRLQWVEGDRIRTPPGSFPSGEKYNPADFLHGVQTDGQGKAQHYSVCRRARASDFSLASGMFYFERLVPADACWLHGYFDRIDQTRGVSPLSSSINVFRDVYEGCSYALAKLKVSQLFGLVTTRDSDDPLGTITTQPAIPPIPLETTVYDDAPQPSGYKVDFGRGPFHLDLNKEETASFLEADSPGPSMQEFVATMIELAFKALDIPFSFYKDNYTNYSGARQALLLYQESARVKRDDNVELLDEILKWRIGLWCDDGDLPGQVEDYAWEWVPAGTPWIDPLSEVQADTQAIATALTSRTRVCREVGLDFEEVAHEIAAENKLLEELGLPTAATPSNAQITSIARDPAAAGSKA
jgi:capsid protein